AVAGVIDHHVRSSGGIERGEQFVHLRAIAGITGIGLRAGFLGERGEFIGRARRQRDRHAGFGESTRQRGRKAGAGADDESGGVIHGAITPTFCRPPPAISIPSSNWRRFSGPSSTWSMS